MYKKTMRAIDAYYKIRIFNAEKEIQNDGLREELLNKEMFLWDDGIRDHYVKLSQVIEDPQQYELNILEKTVAYIKQYKHLDDIVKSKITIIGVNDETKHKK